MYPHLSHNIPHFSHTVFQNDMTPHMTFGPFQYDQQPGILWTSLKTQIKED